MKKIQRKRGENREEKENIEQMFLTEPLSQVVCVSVCVHVLPMLWLHKSVYTMLLWGPLLNADPHDVNTF